MLYLALRLSSCHILWCETDVSEISMTFHLPSAFRCASLIPTCFREVVAPCNRQSIYSVYVAMYLVYNYVPVKHYCCVFNDSLEYLAMCVSIIISTFCLSCVIIRAMYEYAR